MGPGETIGVIAVVVLAIVVLGLAYSAYERRLKFKERKLELEARAAGGGKTSDKAVAKLEARVRVLERIATERGHDVADQIEALREARQLGTTAEIRQSEVNTQ